MRLTIIAWKETCQRKARLVAALIAVGLTVAGLVCVVAISQAWESGIEGHLRAVGPNAFLVPRDLSPSALHRARFETAGLPAYYFDRLLRRGLVRRGAATPVLLRSGVLRDEKVVVRGYDERYPLQGVPEVGPFGPGEVVAGAAAASRLAVGPGDRLNIGGPSFRVAEVRPELGSAADLEVTGHIAPLQQALDVPQKLTLIEVLVADQAEIDRMTGELASLAPDMRLVTRRAIVKTQAEVLSGARRYSFLLVGLIALAAGIGIALQTVINVRERRCEIGTLMAVGASARQVLWMFVQKALFVGLLGGAAGYLVGMMLSMTVGSRIVGKAVSPSLTLLVCALAAGAMLSSLAALGPGLRAARLDPIETLRKR